MKFWRNLGIVLLFISIGFSLSNSAVFPSDPEEKARYFTRSIEFDYIAWELDAIPQKIGQAQISLSNFLSQARQRQVVIRYFDLIRQLEEVQSQIQLIYTDPSIQKPAQTAADKLALQKDLEAAVTSLAPVAESILESQVSLVLAELGVDFLGTPFPPVLFHSSPLPKALIVSPRDAIRQEVNISLLADLTLEEISTLEDRVAAGMDASSLVVDVGGIGVYPTMVQRSSNMSWFFDTIAHEWTHNYLTLHPLGLNYDTSPELRTMNETTASIAGNEISQRLLERYYPELQSADSPGKFASLNAPPQVFDFRTEMYTTRVHVDELLSQGKIQEAEQYMEERRIFIVQHGYMIRKLNQAYFAFYGAYALSPGGVAGEDPVGPAVRALRENSPTLADFLRKIAAMNSFEKLQNAIP